jgi:hypothetical protein
MLSSGEDNYVCVKLHKFWRQKVMEAKGWFGICGIICHSNFGNSILTHMKAESEAFYATEFFLRSISITRFFLSFQNRMFWKLILRPRVVCGQLYCTKHLVVQHCANESYFLHLTCGRMSCHQWTLRIWIHVVILVRKSLKWKFVLHELCISTYVCWVAHVVC